MSGPFRYASTGYEEAIAKGLKRIRTAVSAPAAQEVLAFVEEKWGNANPGDPATVA